MKGIIKTLKQNSKFVSNISINLKNVLKILKFIILYDVLLILY